MVEATYAVSDDREWLVRRDDSVSEDWVARCLSQREYLVASERAGRVGFLRFSLFWGTIPYLEMIRVDEVCRGCGIGTRLLTFWRGEMEQRGPLADSSRLRKCSSPRTSEQPLRSPSRRLDPRPLSPCPRGRACRTRSRSCRRSDTPDVHFGLLRRGRPDLPSLAGVDPGTSNAGARSIDPLRPGVSVSHGRGTR